MTGLETAALIAFAAGSAVSAVGSIAGGFAQQEAYDYNARVAEMHAAAAEDAARLEEETSRKRTARVLGTVKARAAASGLSISEGSPLDVLAENAAEGELDALLARYQGTVEAGRARSAAEMARRQGRQAVVGGFMGAGAQLLTSAGSAYKLYGPSKPSSGFDPYAGANAARSGYSYFGGPR